MIDKIVTKKTGLNKTFLINVFSTIILQGFAFITMPVFARILGSEQYGYYALFNSWVGIVSSFLSLNISSGIGAGSYKYKEEYHNFRNNVLLYTIAMSLFSVVICLLAYPLFSIIVDFEIDIFALMLLTAFSSTVISTVNNILVYEKRALLKLIISLLLTVTNFIASLLFIYLLKPKQLYLGKVYGHFVVYFVFSIAFIIYFFTKNKFRVSTKYVKFCALYGVPLVLHSLSGNILSQSDRIMMQKMGIEMSSIGIYSLFFTFSSVMSTILSAFNTSFVPFYYDYIDKNDRENMINKSQNYSELFTVLAIGFLLLSREVSKVMAPAEFYPGIELIPIFVSSIFCTFLYHFPANYEFFNGNTIYVSIGTVLSAVINVLLNYILIKRFGVFGAGIATLVSSLLLFIFHYIIAINIKEKKYNMSIKFFVKHIFFYLCAVILFYLLKEHVVLRWMIGAAIGAYEVFRIYRRKCFF